MRTVALVPIKLNNERLPGKNLLPMPDGRSILQRVLDTLREVSEIDEVVVYCSDSRITPLVEEAGATFRLRSATLDTSETRSNDIIGAFLSQDNADIVALCHATSPFLSGESLSQGLTAVMQGGFDSSLSVERVHNFYWLDGKPQNYDPANIPRTQDLAPILLETSAFYIFRREVFLEQGARTGTKPHLVEVAKTEAIDIDDPVDFHIASALVRAELERDGTQSTPGAPIGGLA